MAIVRVCVHNCEMLVLVLFISYQLSTRNVIKINFLKIICMSAINVLSGSLDKSKWHHVMQKLFAAMFSWRKSMASRRMAV